MNKAAVKKLIDSNFAPDAFHFSAETGELTPIELETSSRKLKS